MYQLVVTVREQETSYHVVAILSELLPAGGVAPVADRAETLPAGPERALQDPFVGILQSLSEFARKQLEETVASVNIPELF